MNTPSILTARRLALVTLLSLAAATATYAQRPVDKLDARLKIALAQSRAQSASASTARTRAMRDIFIEGDPAQIRRVVALHGGAVRTVAGTIVTASVPQHALLEIAGAKGIERLHGAAPMRRFNDVAAHDVKADAVWTAPPQGEQPYTGKGVIVGIIDTGIDWTHPDFRDPEDSTKSRILAIWDQNDSLGVGPEGLGYGTVWTKEQIDAALASGDRSTVRHRDELGHGTHVAGTAAGNGLALGRHRGMAYEADIAVVGLKWESSTSIVDAASYLFELGRKLGRPVVLNLSLGSTELARDGSDPSDRALDALVREQSGRVVCVAAGNLGDMASHFGASLDDEPTWTYVTHDPSVPFMDPSTGLSIVLKAIVPKSVADAAMIAVGVDSVAVGERGIEAISADTSAWTSIADIVASQEPGFQDLSYSDGTLAARALFAASPEGNDHYAVYAVISDIVAEDFEGENPYGGGADYFRLFFKGAGDVHMWATMGVPVDTAHLASHVDEQYHGWDNRYSVTSPATAHTALSVGATSNVTEFENYKGETVPYENAGIPGELATFSSVGPTIDGRVKPEIVAPGHGVTSSLATNLRDVFAEMPGSPVAAGGYHAIFSGTSMACPVVTGAVALYLEKSPSASYEQVKNAITSTARKDHQTGNHGALPNPHWGYGKLDIYRAIYQTTASVDEPGSIGGMALAHSAPNPASTTSTIAFTLDARRTVHLDLVDAKGTVRTTLLDGTLEAGEHSVTVDATSLAPGVYTYRLVSGATVRTGQMTVVR